MVDGRWSMVDGRWSMVDGRWSIVDGRWSMVDGRQSAGGAKTVEPARRGDIGGVDVIDPRAGRTATQRQFESHHRLCIAFGYNFDAAIVLVADVAVKPLTPGGVFGKHPEPPPLNSALDD